VNKKYFYFIFSFKRSISGDFNAIGWGKNGLDPIFILVLWEFICYFVWQFKTGVLK